LLTTIQENYFLNRNKSKTGEFDLKKQWCKY